MEVSDQGVPTHRGRFRPLTIAGNHTAVTEFGAVEHHQILVIPCRRLSAARTTSRHIHIKANPPISVADDTISTPGELDVGEVLQHYLA